MKQKEKLYIGIDPGKDGAICLRDSHETIATLAMPLINNEIDIYTIDRFFKDNMQDRILQVVLEDVHTIFGSSAGATFEFGRGLGIIEGILTANSIPFLKVQPKEWQRVLFQGIPEKRKPNKINGQRGSLLTKPMAHLAIVRLYPEVELKKSARAKNPHLGIIDGLCMMHYCYMKFK